MAIWPPIPADLCEEIMDSNPNPPAEECSLPVKTYSQLQGNDFPNRYKVSPARRDNLPTVSVSRGQIRACRYRSDFRGYHHFSRILFPEDPDTNLNTAYKETVDMTLPSIKSSPTNWTLGRYRDITERPPSPVCDPSLS